MATIKSKKAPAKKTSAKKTTVKKAVSKKSVSLKKTVRKTAATRRPFISRSDEYTQLTWVLVSVWLFLIVIFLGTVINKTS